MPAYSPSIAFESIPHQISSKWNGESFDGVSNADLECFARTVAYKVAYNLRNGFPMDYTIDPLHYLGQDPHYDVIIWKTNMHPKIRLLKT